ncbi:MAG: NFACT RNA binding domain-containing protein [Acidobacteriota bacterium]
MKLNQGEGPCAFAFYIFRLAALRLNSILNCATFCWLNMDDQSIRAVTAELESLLVGRAPGRIFQLGPLSWAIDFHLRDHPYLFISIDPALSRLHLVNRRTKDLEKLSAPLSQLALALRRDLSHTTARSVKKDAGDRVVRIHFEGIDESGKESDWTLVAQLTGRSANLFLIDESGIVRQRARATDVPGQQVGNAYEPPGARTTRQTQASESELLKTIRSGKFDSPSEAADAHYTSLLSLQDFDLQAGTARSKLRKKITQQKKLLQQLQNDLESHADREANKRLGDLLLANLTTARRTGNRVKLIDYFAADAPSIDVEIDENLTLQEEAARRFALYSRSKRAVEHIGSRLEAARSDVAKLEAKLVLLEKLVAERDEAALATFIAGGAARTPSAGGSKKKEEKKIPGTRRYLSSDGFEILVGRAARDNDHLTFKVAKPNDLWLHAADYGGSHVVVRNSTRKEIPHRTIIEAAQLAAYFSQARKDSKVDVHYTERKFLSKPKGSAPGLVRLLRSKNITVKPQEAAERI